MLASPFVPTPMLRGRCSKRPRRKWAVSWRRFDKSYRASRAPERKQLPLRCSFILSAHFRLWVTVWVRQLTHILTHTISSVFATKKHRKPKFSMLFGAGGVTRTPDLLITNQLLYQLSYTSLLTFCGTPLSLSLATISDLLITKCIRALHLAVFRAFGVFPLDTFRVFQPTRSIVSIRSFPRVGQRVGQAPLPCTEVFPMIIVHILRRYMC